MNQIVLIGRLARDPELRYLNSGKAVCSFTLAVDRYGKDQSADFIPCVAWEKRAETVAEYLRKGSQAAVSGSLRSRKYEKDGQKRTAWEVLANDVRFLGGKQPQQRRDDEPPPEAFGADLEFPDEDIPF